MGQGGAVGGQAGDPTALSGTMGPFSDASMLLSASSLHSGRLCIPAFSDLLSQSLLSQRTSPKLAGMPVHGKAGSFTQRE